jgi:hypothetical protein
MFSTKPFAVSVRRKEFYQTLLSRICSDRKAIIALTITKYNSIMVSHLKTGRYITDMISKSGSGYLMNQNTKALHSYNTDNTSKSGLSYLTKGN